MTVRFLSAAALATVFLAGAQFAAQAEDAKPITTGKTPELKVLDRLLGTWDSKTWAKVAEWTPNEQTTTGTLTREWTLDGNYLLETSKHTDQDGLHLFTFDAQTQKYRVWHFSSQGWNVEGQGKWDEKTQTLTTTSESPGGLTGTATLRIIDRDTHEWTAVTKDRDGKIYFNGGGKCTRKK